MAIFFSCILTDTTPPPKFGPYSFLKCSFFGLPDFPSREPTVNVKKNQFLGCDRPWGFLATDRVPQKGCELTG